MTPVSQKGKCVHCGKKSTTKKVLHSEATDRYYEVLLCDSCDELEHITVSFGGKRELSKTEIERLLIQ